MKRFLLFLVSIILCFSLAAQNTRTIQENQAYQAFAQKGQVKLLFNVATREQINHDLTKIISIDNVKELPGGKGFEVIAYASPMEYQRFLLKNIPFEIIPESPDKSLNMAITVAQMSNWDRYPVYNVYEQMMANFASNYPDLCDIDTILSQTPSGNYRILVAKISDNVHTAENEPQILLSSSIHGDETTGYYLMLRLINYLLTNYGSVTQVSNLVNGAEIWICPLANPDGTYYNSSPAGSTIANSRRYNLAGMDLNRNYPDPLDGDHPDGNTYGAETQAFMDFADNHHFNLSANFHGGAEVVNYPWDTWTTPQNPNADAAWWERVCTNYVATARQVYSTYMTDTYSDGVTEGGDWYTITGGRQDYMNYFKKCREVTIELDGTKTTATENLNLKWNENYASLLNYMQESLYGVRGIITDSCSGQPIRAKVWVNNYDQLNDSSHVYSALPVGNYHKYMIAGTYSITFSAPGYTSKTITSVVLANGAATTVNVALVPAASPDAQFTGSVSDNCSGTAVFTNTSTAATGFLWDFGDGSTSTLANPTHTYTANGTYTVKLHATNCKGADSLVRTSYISVNMATPPAVTNGYTCGSGTVALTATAAGTIKWYDAATNGNLLNTGTSYLTPVLTNTTTYYAENNQTGTPVTVGKTFVLSGGGSSSTGEHYLIFDAYMPFTLISVKMYNASTSSVSRTIALKNSSGTVINNQTATLSIPVGLSTVTLNFAVPTGTNMCLSCSDGSNLYRNNTGGGYNYTATGLCSIKGSDAGSNYYYYFYEWLIQAPGCVSPRVPVTASVLNVPVAGFTSSITSFTANFTNSSTGSTTYLWNFGDGNTSTLQNPSHTYSSGGTYQVMLIASNSGCSDTVTQNVTIQAGSGYTISGKTRYTGKANAGSPPPAYPTYNSTIYDINKVIVILKNYPSGTEVRRDTSDAAGNYQFANVANGTYILSYDKYTADTMQWGNDINAIDLSQIKYLINTDTLIDPTLSFAAKYKKAANVDDNTSINAVDLARIKAKIGSPATAAKNFPKGNWVALDTMITVSGANQNINLKTICYGDYNASSTKYRDSTISWSQAKSFSNEIISISDEYITVSNPEYFEVPLRISSKIKDFAALGLELSYPDNRFRLVGASMPHLTGKNLPVKINPTLDEIISNDDDLLVTDENGIIRVVYATADYSDAATGDEILRLMFQSVNKPDQGELSFYLSGNGVVGNKYGDEIEGIFLMMPKIFIQGNIADEDFTISGYPNPFGDLTNILYTLPEDGFVSLKVYNDIGDLVAVITCEKQQKGKHQATFSSDHLPQGIYTFKLDFSGLNIVNCMKLKMIH